MKPEWDSEFDNEVDIYERLKAVQGHLIPKCYGIAWCNGLRALVLSEVKGILPFEQPLDSPLEVPEFCRRLQAAFDELGNFGLMHDDPKLDNFLLVDDRVVILDLESVEEGKDEKVIERVIDSNVDFARLRYKSWLEDRYIPW